MGNLVMDNLGMGTCITQWRNHLQRCPASRQSTRTPTITQQICTHQLHRQERHTLKTHIVKILIARCAPRVVVQGLVRPVYALLPAAARQPVCINCDQAVLFFQIRLKNRSITRYLGKLAKFEQLVEEFIERSEQLRAISSQTEEASDLRKAFFSTAKSCRGCHKRFRKPRD